MAGEGRQARNRGVIESVHSPRTRASSLDTPINTDVDYNIPDDSISAVLRHDTSTFSDGQG